MACFSSIAASLHALAYPPWNGGLIGSFIVLPCRIATILDDCPGPDCLSGVVNIQRLAGELKFLLITITFMAGWLFDSTQKYSLGTPIIWQLECSRNQAKYLIHLIVESNGNVNNSPALHYCFAKRNGMIVCWPLQLKARILQLS